MKLADLADKQFRIIEATFDEILIQDVTMGYPGGRLYSIQAVVVDSPEEAELRISELQPKKLS